MEKATERDASAAGKEGSSKGAAPAKERRAPVRQGSKGFLSRAEASAKERRDRQELVGGDQAEDQSGAAEGSEREGSSKEAPPAKERRAPVRKGSEGLLSRAEARERRELARQGSSLFARGRADRPPPAPRRAGSAQDARAAAGWEGHAEWLMQKETAPPRAKEVRSRLAKPREEEAKPKEVRSRLAKPREEEATPKEDGPKETEEPIPPVGEAEKEAEEGKESGEDAQAAALEQTAEQNEKEAAEHREKVKQAKGELKDLPKGSAERVAKMKEMMAMQGAEREAKKRARKAREELEAHLSGRG